MEMTQVSERLERGMKLLQRGLFAEAEKELLSVSTNSPLFPETLQAIAIAISHIDREAEALCLLEAAAALAPTHVGIHYNLAVMSGELGQTEKAILAYQVCLRLEPRHVDALWNYSELLRTRMHFGLALEKLRELKMCLPEQREATYYHRLAVTLSELSQYEEAREAFELSIKIGHEEVAVTYWEYAHMLLSIAEWEQGWAAYDYRFAAGNKISVVCHDFPYPLWQNQDLSGKTLLIHGEQGLGDEIMFGSIVPEIRDRFKDVNIIWACQPPLTRLFAYANPDVEVISHQVIHAPTNLGAKKVDYQIPVCSLGRWFRRSDEEFQSNVHRLNVHPEQVMWFKQRLAMRVVPQGGKRKKLLVGLMWGANPGKDVVWGRKRSLRKSISIQQLLPLNQFCDDIQYVSLQNRDVATEAALAPELNLLDFHSDLFDMADTAALMENMDLIISVDTSIAHLAGVLGKPVWILLMEQADWRWLRQGSDSIWYSNARLFRQRTQGQWDEVIDDLCSELRGWVKSQASSSGVGGSIDSVTDFKSTSE